MFFFILFFSTCYTDNPGFSLFRCKSFLQVVNCLFIKRVFSSCQKENFLKYSDKFISLPWLLNNVFAFLIFNTRAVCNTKERANILDLTVSQIIALNTLIQSLILEFCFF